MSCSSFFPSSVFFFSLFLIVQVEKETRSCSTISQHLKTIQNPTSRHIKTHQDISRPQNHHRTTELQHASSQPTGLRAKTLRPLAPTSGATLRDGMGDMRQDIARKSGLPPKCQVVVEEKEVPFLDKLGCLNFP